MGVVPRLDRVVRAMPNPIEKMPSTNIEYR